MIRLPIQIVFSCQILYFKSIAAAAAADAKYIKNERGFTQLNWHIFFVEFQSILCAKLLFSNEHELLFFEPNITDNMNQQIYYKQNCCQNRKMSKWWHYNHIKLPWKMCPFSAHHLCDGRDHRWKCSMRRLQPATAPAVMTMATETSFNITFITYPKFVWNNLNFFNLYSKHEPYHATLQIPAIRLDFVVFSVFFFFCLVSAAVFTFIFIIFLFACKNFWNNNNFLGTQ